MWPSNGNGNAFVFPIRMTGRQTDLIVTIWDGSESMEEANPIGKVVISLEPMMSILSSSQGDPDHLPAPVDYSVDLVPRLAAIAEECQPATLSIITARADPEFSREGGKEGAVTDLLRRLQARRRRDRMNRLAQWSSAYSVHGVVGRGRKGGSDYSLVALLTSDQSPKNVDDGWSPPDPPPISVSSAETPPAALETTGDGARPMEGMLERLAQTAGAGRSVAAPLRAQAALLSRLRPVQFEDGEMILAAGAGPASFFFIRTGHCSVFLRGTAVNRLGPGQFLGEIGLLFGERRLADVKADGPCSLFELDGDDLWLALDMFPGLFTDLKRLAEARYDRVRCHQQDAPPACAPASGPSEDEGRSASLSGPLREFQLFLQDIASHIHSAEGAVGAARVAKQRTEAAGGVSRDEASRLHSISEGEDEHYSAQTHFAVQAVDAEASLAAHRLLVARMERMEKDGTFGPPHAERGMGVPGAIQQAGCGSPLAASCGLSSSMRAAVVPVVGSLEHARSRRGSADANAAGGLSPPTNDGWSRSSSGSDSEEEAAAPDACAAHAAQTEQARAPIARPRLRVARGRSGLAEAHLARARRQDSGARDATSQSALALRSRCLRCAINPPPPRLSHPLPRHLRAHSPKAPDCLLHPAFHRRLPARPGGICEATTRR